MSIRAKAITTISGYARFVEQMSLTGTITASIAQPAVLRAGGYRNVQIADRHVIFVMDKMTLDTLPDNTTKFLKTP